ncbi:flavin reductase family protein [Maritimibacter sp. HL-12]|jgi:flavin reductase (DIM6/NTAB) family NADH-FMN oxidoreductase RutF|uniref:flavin reductase family protein n=1 Tax=Maritimibacter sp. HL-12 TaxID=1162418 RepID=UPI000A0EF8F3|nr:flavin reductase family protein [Maritimibacter sp. HL-12]SMH54419.1 NADH-FMN oxidoreductase RutF, flavin reductase (DIM6/NTAB) family [Maritimibacter sp. HL-12]
MFYRPEDGHGLPHNPFNAIIAPRPIAWISTRGSDGHDNLAPYSFFNGAAYVPPQVMFSTTGDKPDRLRGKDTLGNIEQTGVFCINVVEEEAMHEMNASSAAFPARTDEFAAARVTKAACKEIACSRVALSPAALECRMTQVVKLKGDANYVVFGDVVGVHLRDDCLVDGKFDIAHFGLVARLGYRDYTIVRDYFELTRPDD